MNERTVIASLLNGGWPYAGHLLTEADFTDIRLRKIFRAIRKLGEKGSAVDLFTVGDAIGEPLQDFLTEIAPAKNARSYAEELKDKTLQREVVNAAREIMGLSGSGKERLIQAQSMLADLHSGYGGEVVHVSEAVTDWWEELGQRAEGGDFLKTGFPDTDRRLGGLRGGDLIILAGRPSMGKTALALNIATQCGKPAVFFSLEMSTSNLLDRLAASVSGVHLGKIRTPAKLAEDEWRAVTEASVKIKEARVFLDDTGGISIEEIHARARSLQAKEGLSLVIVDYLQLVEADQRLSREQQVSHISRHGKRMAKDLNVPVILLAQLSRKCEDRHDKRPLMSDLRDSGAIEQDADVVAFVYRDEVYDKASQHAGYAELIFRKVRQGETGTDWFHFDGPHQQFKQAAEPPRVEAPVKRGPYKQHQPHWAD